MPLSNYSTELKFSHSQVTGTGAKVSEKAGQASVGCCRLGIYPLMSSWTQSAPELVGLCSLRGLRKKAIHLSSVPSPTLTPPLGRKFSSFYALQPICLCLRPERNKSKLYFSRGSWKEQGGQGGLQGMDSTDVEESGLGGALRLQTATAVTLILSSWKIVKDRAEGH